MSKKKKSAKSAIQKKSVNESPTAIEIVSTEEKKTVEDKSIPTFTDFLRKPKFLVKPLSLADKLLYAQEIEDDSDQFCIAVNIFIPNFLSTIKYATTIINTEPFLELEDSKKWNFVISHNFCDDTKDMMSPEFFLSISMMYCFDSAIPVPRYVRLRVIYPQEKPSNTHTFTSYPILFDGNSNSYKFGNVISFSEILNPKWSILSDGNIRIIICVIPASPVEFSPETQMLMATQRNDVDTIRRLIAGGCSIDCTSDFFATRHGSYLEGATPLIVACNDHANDIAALLIGAGADVHATNSNGDSAVHRACWSGNSDVLQALVVCGADINLENNSGMTPLMAASLAGNAKVVEFLLKENVEIDSQDYEGNSAFHFACIQGNCDIISQLLSASCTLSIKNLAGRSAIDCTTDSHIQNMIITNNRVMFLVKPVSPFQCRKPFQVPSQTLSTLFLIGANVMKFVAAGIADFPVFPYELLTTMEKGVLLQRVFDCVIQHRTEKLEVNILTESLFFACFYVLTNCLQTSREPTDAIKTGEKVLRQLIMQSYEDVYHEKLNGKGISILQSHASVFITILDLVLLSCIDDFAVKRGLFQNMYRGLAVHNPLVAYPSLSEGYFATLPITRSDEFTIHLLISKKQMMIPQVDGNFKEIVASLVSQLAGHRSTQKLSFTQNIPVDYCALQMQLQMLTEREIVPYNPRLAITAKPPNSNIYGHHMRAASDLQSDAFKQFWALLPLSEKCDILSIDVKELQHRMKESVYWFVMRYVLNNWSALIPDSNSMGISRRGSLLFIEENNINDEMMQSIITGASTYDYCVMAASGDTPSHVFDEPVEYNSTDMEDLLVFFSTVRFKFYFYWLLCDRIDFAYQMHQKEEEADRVAAILLNEDINEMEMVTKSKKKRRKNKAKKDSAADDSVSISTGTKSISSTPVLAPTQAAKPAPMTSSPVVVTASASVKPKSDKSPSVPTSTSLFSPVKSVLANPSVVSVSVPVEPESASALKNIVEMDLSSCKTSLTNDMTKPDVVPSTVVHHIPADQRRVNRFLMGDNRDKTDMTVVADRKKEKDLRTEKVERPFISLRQILLRPDPLEELIAQQECEWMELDANSSEVAMGEMFASVVPSLPSFSRPMSSQAYDCRCVTNTSTVGSTGCASVTDNNSDVSSVLTGSFVMTPRTQESDFNCTSNYTSRIMPSISWLDSSMPPTIRPSQLLQQTLHQSLGGESVDVMCRSPPSQQSYYMMYDAHRRADDLSMNSPIGYSQMDMSVMPNSSYDTIRQDRYYGNVYAFQQYQAMRNQVSPNTDNPYGI